MRLVWCLALLTNVVGCMDVCQIGVSSVEHGTAAVGGHVASDVDIGAANGRAIRVSAPSSASCTAGDVDCERQEGGGGGLQPTVERECDARML